MSLDQQWDSTELVRINIGHVCELLRGGVGTCTVLGLLHPCDGDASIFTRFTEAQEEGSRRFVLEQSFLLLFINKAHYIPEHAAERREKERHLLHAVIIQASADKLKSGGEENRLEEWRGYSTLNAPLNTSLDFLPIIPDVEEASFDEVQYPINPQPESHCSLIWCRLKKKKRK